MICDKDILHSKDKSKDAMKGHDIMTATHNHLYYFKN